MQLEKRDVGHQVPSELLSQPGHLPQRSLWTLLLGDQGTILVVLVTVRADLPVVKPDDWDPGALDHYLIGVAEELQFVLIERLYCVHDLIPVDPNPLFCYPQLIVRKTRKGQ